MVSDVSGFAARGKVAAGLGPRGNSSECPKIRIGTLNVCTMNSKSDKLAETFSRRTLGLCCVQKTRWETLLKIFDDNGVRYEYYGSGMTNKFGGNDILGTECLWENIFEIISV